LGQESEIRPKPLVEIGGKPILWHIMKYYAHFGCRDFILCLGYKGEMIKRYFLDYELVENDVTIELGAEPRINYHDAHQEQGWRVTMADTGVDAFTGARVKRIEKYVAGESFMLTYGDGVSDVDLDKLLDFHKSHGKIATVTAVHPPARFGELTVDGGQVAFFSEKPQTSVGCINGGFFVFRRELFDCLRDADDCTLEQEALTKISADGELMAFQHSGFWQCVDTVREMEILRGLWESGRAPWKVW